MRKVAFCALILVLSEPSWASDAYVGGSLIRSYAASASRNVTQAQDLVTALGASSSIQYHDRAIGASVFAGADFLPYLGAEGGMMYLGNYDISGNVAVGSVSASSSGSDQVMAFYVAGIARLPIGNLFSLYGKTGLALTLDRETYPGGEASPLSRAHSSGLGPQCRPQTGYGSALKLTI